MRLRVLFFVLLSLNGMTWAGRNIISLELASPGNFDFEYERKFSDFGVGIKTGIVPYVFSQMFLRAAVQVYPSMSGSYYMELNRNLFFKPQMVLGAQYYSNDEGRPNTTYGSIYYYLNPRANLVFDNGKVMFLAGMGFYSGITEKFRDSQTVSNLGGRPDFSIDPSLCLAIGIPF